MLISTSPTDMDRHGPETNASHPPVKHLLPPTPAHVNPPTACPTRHKLSPTLALGPATWQIDDEKNSAARDP